MADCKQNINRHLNSAQQWLSEAEEAFDKDKDIRGELNLFLAQAELTHVREVNRSQQWRYKYPLLRHCLALGLAFAVAVGGVGVSYWWGVSRHTVQSVTGTNQAVSPTETSSRQVTLEPKAASQAVAPVAAPPVPVASQSVTDREDPGSYQQPAKAARVSEPIAQTKQVSEEDPSKEVPLTTDEINKLIRSAGKSLRGQ